MATKIKTPKKPKALIIKPVPDELWQALVEEKERILTANKFRKAVSVGERLVNLVKKKGC